jgi:aminoglycoside phosphotransferase (APT) family kinase protein
LALARLPPTIVSYLTRPGIDWEHVWADVPWTLLHGDVKVANFAIVGDGRVTAFDWAMVGTGPCTIDVGWYLAVNATRLTRSKEEILRKYRLLLEFALGHGLSDPLWSRLEAAAVVSGARMLLWSKTLALELGRPGAADEWNWWVSRLVAIRPAFDGGPTPQAPDGARVDDPHVTHRKM